MLRLLRTFSWTALRHHPWLGAVAVLAVMLGVALAFSVHLINQSALDEFSSAVRVTSGEPDVELRAASGGFDEALFARVANHPQVALANPVLEVSTFTVGANGQRVGIRVVGLDALSAAQVSPALIPTLATGEDRLRIFAPDAVFLNAAARKLAGGSPSLRLQSGLAMREARVAGSVAAGGPPLAAMDIGAAQDFFARGGQLSRIDVKLVSGVSRAAFIRSLALPAGVIAAEPGDASKRVDHLSRAYRVNLTVLALVALFTGAFLVYSILALSVAQRAQQFALLGVLGLTARERGVLVVAESLVLGGVGSLLGIGLGTALAAVGLNALGGDLGGGYFPGVAPALHWSGAAALLYGALGCVAAAAGGWLPARAAQALPLAQTLKGLGVPPSHARRRALGVVTLVAGLGCALLPPVAGIPIGAYVSVGLLLVGGITILPGAIALLHAPLAAIVGQRPLPMLALERARRVRESAAIAVSGVVASLSLAVALTVMVASFRDSVAHWLDVVLPADLYLRSAGSSQSADTAWFSPKFVSALSQVDGVERIGAQRMKLLTLDASLPAVVLLARDMDDASRVLPLVGDASSVPEGAVPIFVSEAMVDLYGAKPGHEFPRLANALGVDARFVVAGVWRDYVRQNGAIAMRRADYTRLTGDRLANDIQLYLRPGANIARVETAARGIARSEGGIDDALEFGSARELRAISLRIFDRSFAVTYWLQAVAIGIGLFGVAASFSAQVLARRKEFGLLAHLGFTRAQMLRVVGGEGAVWTGLGSIAGLALGLAVAVVLVHVVNPQSFHWTMDLLVPWGRLLILCAAVVVAGTVTARLAGGKAAARDAVLAVKEDW